MYSQQDIDDAVASGVMTAEAADALRAHIERQRSTVIPDEEQFRLITGFNDIFVSIAAAILLFAVGWIGQKHRPGDRACHLRAWRDRTELRRPAGDRSDLLGTGALLHRAPPDGAAVDPATSGIRRRGSRHLGLLLAQIIGPDRFSENDQLLGALVGGVERGDRRRRGLASLAPLPCADHRRRRSSGRRGAVPRDRDRNHPAGRQRKREERDSRFRPAPWHRRVPVRHVVGWLRSRRITRRSDVAFWLHLLAAPMIAHPIFSLLGLNSGGVSAGEALLWSACTFCSA